MREAVSPKVWGELGPVALSSLLLCLSDLREGKIEASRPSFSYLQGSYAQVIGGKLIAKGFPQRLEKAPEGDPVSVFYPGEQNPEIRLVAEGLDYLQGSPEDLYLATLFWQAIRIRTLTTP